MSNARNNPRRLAALARIEAKRADAADDTACAVIVVSVNVETGERRAPRVESRLPRDKAEALALRLRDGAPSGVAVGTIVVPVGLERAALARAAR